MRVLIVSDIHANSWALEAILRDAGPVDFFLGAGDCVNYGPDPRGAVELLRRQNAIVVRGNHDHAVAFGADPKASPTKQHLALALRDWTGARLGPAGVGWLSRLPLALTWECGGTRFLIVHATPLDPLFDYRLVPQASDTLLDEAFREVQADVAIVGHTHWPFLREHRGMQVVNPGSAGQPLDGDRRAAYALWEDGRIALCRAAYDQSGVVEALQCLPIAHSLIDELESMLRDGKMS